MLGISRQRECVPSSEIKIEYLYLHGASVIVCSDGAARSAGNCWKKGRRDHRSFGAHSQTYISQKKVNFIPNSSSLHTHFLRDLRRMCHEFISSNTGYQLAIMANPHRVPNISRSFSFQNGGCLKPGTGKKRALRHADAEGKHRRRYNSRNRTDEENVCNKTWNRVSIATGEVRDAEWKTQAHSHIRSKPASVSRKRKNSWVGGEALEKENEWTRA
ncbi:hypothetical protein CBL_09661 [Carabus blaptoides fortunei]